MDRVKVRLDHQELSELLSFVQWFVDMHQPGQLRMKYMEMSAPEKATSKMVSLLCNRLLLRLATLSIRMKSEHLLNIPGEEGLALLYAWTTTPTKARPQRWPLAQHLIGTIDQQTA